jgi:hypothetical protein
MRLTPRQLEYGFTYYFKDEWKTIPVARTVAEYRGGRELSVNCTQLSARDGFPSPSARQRVVEDWCRFLESHPKTFTRLSFGTRMPQELFDAACCQVNLVRLDINWSACADLSSIAGLQKLRLLEIGSGASIRSLAPLTSLQGLIGLSLGNLQKITDYSSLARLRKLQSLTIEGNALGPQSIRIDSLSFLERMTQLRFFSLLTARLTSKDFRPVLALRKLQHLTLPSSKEVRQLYDELIRLPRLRWGLLKANPTLYKA